jgi:hypothetical protein
VTQMKRRTKNGALAIAAAACVALAVVGFGPGMVRAMNAVQGSYDNDTAVLGSYDTYDPSASSDGASGKAIEGSDEEKLQQERIAGGAVGEVTSTNLEELSGIVDATYDSYRPSTGIYDQAPAIDLSDPGIVAAMPLSHEDSNLDPQECATCHADASGSVREDSASEGGSSAQDGTR